MKAKIACLLVTVMILFSVTSCSVSVGGHGRVGHPPRVHHIHGHDRD